MDANERARLRAMREGIAMPWRAQPTIVDGDDVECAALVTCPHGEDGDRDTVAEIDMGYGEECDDAHAALIVGSVNALPAALDALDSAEGTIAELRDKLAEMEAIIAGRTTPPTDAEVESHWRAGGTWMNENHVLRSVEDARRFADGARRLRSTVAWIAIRDGRPCAWPVVP